MHGLADFKIRMALSLCSLLSNSSLQYLPWKSDRYLSNEACFCRPEALFPSSIHFVTYLYPEPFRISFLYPNVVYIIVLSTSPLLLSLEVLPMKMLHAFSFSATWSSLCIRQHLFTFMTLGKWYRWYIYTVSFYILTTSIFNRLLIVWTSLCATPFPFIFGTWSKMRMLLFALLRSFCHIPIHLKKNHVYTNIFL
jgi:hypothetical protein